MCPGMMLKEGCRRLRAASGGGFSWLLGAQGGGCGGALFGATAGSAQHIHEVGSGRLEEGLQRFHECVLKRLGRLEYSQNEIAHEE